MTTETEAILKLAQKSGHTIRTSDGQEFLIIPAGYTSAAVSEEGGLRIGNPRYIKQAISVQTTDSLVEYVNRFKGRDTILFANVMASSVVAQIDYHGARIEPYPAPAAGVAQARYSQEVEDRPSNLGHRATLDLMFSTEWQAWNAASGQLVNQLSFARFIEENDCDVRLPSGAELLECVRDFHSHRKVSFVKAVRTSSGTEKFEYSDDTNSSSRKGGSIETPTKFLLSIPVYFGESDVEIHAFLRWEIDADAGSLKLGIKLHRAEYVRQAVFKQIVVNVAERTGCLAVFGNIR